MKKAEIYTLRHENRHDCFPIEIEQNLQSIPERMHLVRLWNISWGKVERDRKLFGFIGKVVFDFGQQKNTFSWRKRVRKYPTSLQKCGNPFIYKGFPHRLTIYLTANWLRIAVRFYTITKRCNPFYKAFRHFNTSKKAKDFWLRIHTLSCMADTEKRPAGIPCRARCFQFLTISCRKKGNRHRIVDKRFPECYNILINTAHILIFSLSFHII